MPFLLQIVTKYISELHHTCIDLIAPCKPASMPKAASWLMLKVHCCIYKMGVLILLQLLCCDSYFCPSQLLSCFCHCWLVDAIGWLLLLWNNNNIVNMTESLLVNCWAFVTAGCCFYCCHQLIVATFMSTSCSSCFGQCWLVDVTFDYFYYDVAVCFHCCQLLFLFLSSHQSG